MSGAASDWSVGALVANPLDDPGANFPVVYSPGLRTFPVAVGTTSVISRTRAEELVDDHCTFSKPGPAQFSLRLAVVGFGEDAHGPLLVWVITWRGGTPAFHPAVTADQVDCVTVMCLDATTGAFVGHRHQFCRTNPDAATPPDWGARFRRLRQRRHVDDRPNTDEDRLRSLTSQVAAEVGGMTRDQAERRVAAEPALSIRLVPPGPVSEGRVAARVTAWIDSDRIYKAVPL